MREPRPALRPSSGYRPATPCAACGFPNVAVLCEPCTKQGHTSRVDIAGPPETWLEVPLGDEWLAAYRLAAGADGRPVVAELRVFPAEKKSAAPGRWSVEQLGASAPVPAGGVTASLLRQVRPDSDLREHFRDIVEENVKLPVLTADLDTAGLSTKSALAGPRRGPKGHGALFYARVARDYARLCDRGEANPTAKLASMKKYHGHTPANLRDYVHRARARGLLTDPPAPGKPGGALTEKARRLLGMEED
jgi:hypothetical protein